MQLARVHYARRGSQQGYILLLMLFFAALLIIAMTAAAPKMATEIRREREIEMIHRGEQYARAVQRYYRKFGRYPNRIEDLEKTNNIRFLRKRYKDPMTKDGNWRLVRYGEVQFGGAQALTGATPVANMGTGLQQASPSGFGASSSGASSIFGGGSSSSSSGGFGGASSPQTTSGGNSTEQPASGTTAQSNSLFGQQVVGGGGAIIGVASMSKGVGLHEFNKKSAYKDWLFVYDPTKDKGQLLKGPYNPNAFVGQYNNALGRNSGPGGQPMGGQNPSGFGQSPRGFGQSPTSGFGQSSGGFGQPSSGFGQGSPQPQPPQQPPK